MLKEKDLFEKLTEHLLKIMEENNYDYPPKRHPQRK